MHYVMSDIHGHYDMYLKMLRKIDFSEKDHMYIIGDAVDRGPESIPLLLDIMDRKNITFMIGNHEHMMYMAVAKKDPDQMYSWMMNRGDTTLEQFEALTSGKQEAVLKWLENCPLIIPQLTVCGKKYYLVHACHALYPEKDVLLYKNAGQENIEHVVWSREYRSPDRFMQGYKFRTLYAKYTDTTMIIGHTPVSKCSYGIVTENGSGRISRSCAGHVINIDCGCAAGRTLGCLRLEDGKETYVDNPRKGGGLL